MSWSSSTCVAPFHHATGPSPCSAIEHLYESKDQVSRKIEKNKKHWGYSRKQYTVLSWALSLLERLRSASGDQVRRHKTH